MFQNDLQQEATLRLKIFCGNYTFLPYRLSSDNNTCVITNPAKGIEDSAEQTKQQSLSQKLKKLLLDVEIQSK
jgi:mitogen-activated protein kinase kinase kinase 5